VRPRKPPTNPYVQDSGAGFGVAGNGFADKSHRAC